MLGTKVNGPFEYNQLYKDEQPGPADTRTTKGSLLGFYYDGWYI